MQDRTDFVLAEAAEKLGVDLDLFEQEDSMAREGYGEDTIGIQLYMKPENFDASVAVHMTKIGAEDWHAHFEIVVTVNDGQGEVDVTLTGVKRLNAKSALAEFNWLK